MGTEEIKTELNSTHLYSEFDYGQWIALPVSGPRPAARYKHAAAVVGDKLYIAGGSRNGRYLSDVQVLNLRNLTWSNLNLKCESATDITEDSSIQEGFPAVSDHSMIKWGSKILILGGHSKKSSDSMIVRFIDTETNHCGTMETSGKVPVARGGHSVTLVGSRLIVFGGEDKNRKLLNDIHALDLETKTWEVLETTQTPPAPRFDHSAAAHADRYLLIFGGCSHSVFYSDLHVLDLQSVSTYPLFYAFKKGSGVLGTALWLSRNPLVFSENCLHHAWSMLPRLMGSLYLQMEWSQPEIRGESVNPRAGHASVSIDGNWYIVGGGDNKNGCLETIVLDMSKLVWSILTIAKERDPLASEGLSVCSALIDGENYMVAFGGYNGKYNNEAFVMKIKARDLSRPKIFQSHAAAAAAASVTAAYALAKSEKVDFPEFSHFNSNGLGNNLSEKEIRKIDIDSIKEEKQVLESSLAEVRTENTKLRETIDEVSSTHAELTKELHSVQGQLVAERSRCFKLEAQIAELQNALESLQTIENEVQLLRRQKSTFEQEVELNAAAAEKQGSGGVWKWIGG
ncbi:hypothetical protein ACFE04_010174 [Oxalis oulophora]